MCIGVRWVVISPGRWCGVYQDEVRQKCLSWCGCFFFAIDFQYYSCLVMDVEAIISVSSDGDVGMMVWVLTLRFDRLC